MNSGNIHINWYCKVLLFAVRCYMKSFYARW